MEGIDRWASAGVDHAGWSQALVTTRELAEASPDWAAMVGRGARLAAAHQSGALDGVHPSRPELARALLAGEAALDAVPADERPHVAANDLALQLAAEHGVSEASIRRLHEIACHPQLTHAVRVGDRVQDHVLAAGDYKHHPNHLPVAGGGWRATAPVALVGTEMARVADTAASAQFSGLHPCAQAAYLHHALAHVQPFAAGNGRVARALATGCLLRAIGLPLLAWADADPAAGPEAQATFVERAALDLVAALHDLHRSGPSSDALGRWQRREAVARAVRARLGPAAEGALARYRGNRADLSGATVEEAAGMWIRVPLARGPAVEELLTVDAHPLDGGPQSIAAREAGLRIDAGDAAAGLDSWLDRVVGVLALRVAAEEDDDDDV